MSKGWFNHPTEHALASQGIKTKLPLYTKGQKSELLKTVKDHFGLTENPTEAGYILPNGEMLDFSGKHNHASFKRKNGYNVLKEGEQDFMSGKRSVDHRFLPSELDLEGENNTQKMEDFMEKTNSIAISYDKDGMNVRMSAEGDISKTQWKMLERLSKMTDEMYYDIWTDKKIERGQAFSVSDIKRVYNEVKEKYD